MIASSTTSTHTKREWIVFLLKILFLGSLAALGMAEHDRCNPWMPQCPQYLLAVGTYVAAFESITFFKLTNRPENAGAPPPSGTRRRSVHFPAARTGAAPHRD